MTNTVPLLGSQNSPQFLFRGNGVAAGGFLTMLDGKPVVSGPQAVTTHGESCLPWIGGVSHSFVEKPELRFPQFISYGNCKTFAEGRRDGDQTTATVGASVENVRLTTSPSPTENAELEKWFTTYLPEVEFRDVESISFVAGSLSLELQSFYPLNGKPSFKITPGEPRDLNLLVTHKDGPDTRLPVKLEFDEHFLSLSTTEDIEDAFLGNRQFFDQHACRFPSLKELIFGSSRIPRTPQGYLVTSFVRQIQVGPELIRGNVLSRKGFGTILFGVVLADTYNRRVTMALVNMGSDPAGQVSLDGVETNGIQP